MNSAARSYGEKLRRQNPTKSSFQDRRDSKIQKPTFGNVNTQKSKVDAKSAKNETKDQAAQEEATGVTKEEKETKEAPKKEEPTKEVTENEPDQQASTATDAPTATDDLLHFWNAEAAYDFEQKTFQETNEYTPNSRALFALIDSCLKQIQENDIIKKQHPEFNAYAVKCCFVYYFYLQILRARKAALQITTSENKFLGQFEKFYTMEEMVMPSVFKPYFESIISTELSNTKFSWIAPKIATGMFGKNVTIKSLMTDDSGLGHLIQPHFPTMIGILRYMTTRQAVDELFDTIKEGAKDISKHASEDGDWVPTNIGDGDNKFYDVDLDTNKNVFIMEGVNSRTFVDADVITNGQRKWQSTDFNRTISISPFTTAKTKADQALSHDYKVTSIWEFMMWDQDKPNKWFQSLIDMMIIFCRFFSKTPTTNLAAIKTTGGYEPTIIARYNILDGAKKQWGKRAVSKISHKEVKLSDYRALVTDWHQDPLRDAKVSFFTTRYGFERGHAIVAFSFATHAVLPVTRTGAPASKDEPTKMQLRVGGHGAYQFDSQDSTDMTGPYWTEGDWSFTYGEEDGTGKPMFAKFDDIVRDKYLKINPAFYSKKD